MNGLLTRRQCAKRLQASSQQVTLSGGNSSALQMLPAIPLIDARSDPLTTADPAAVRALRDTICGSFRPIAVRALPLADRIARRWLARSTSPYLAELDAIAAHTRTAGTYAINLSYEYGCTTLARADAPGLAPTLRRTLDWPFRGLGRATIVAHRCGPAGGRCPVSGACRPYTFCAMSSRRLQRSRKLWSPSRRSSLPDLCYSHSWGVSRTRSL